MLILFSLSALSASLLLFWVEPLFAKLVLPLLGGSPAVWNTCLMYFQAMLLLGYLYAHLSSRYLDVRRQSVMHVVIVCLALFALPIGIPLGWTPPTSNHVIQWLIQLLTVGVGAPFLVLAATAPLLQRWISNTDHPAAKNPYMLYAASNAGSLIGLLAFPILLEPHLRLSEQTRLWSFGYAGALILTAACALVVWKRVRARTESTQEEASGAAPTARDRIRWIALAFAPSSLLLGVTTYLSTDVAAMPLLWVIPLALYLITFIIVFARQSTSSSRIIAIVHAGLVTLFVMLAYLDPEIGLRWKYALHLAVFTSTALVLHGELAATRPAPKYLTEFYLLMAFGGALGGAFNALIAPVLFKSITEYQLVVVLACFLRPSWRSRIFGDTDRVRGFVWALVPALMLVIITWMGFAERHVMGLELITIIAILGSALLVSLDSKAIQFGTGIAAIALFTFFRAARSEKVIYRDRSFYGAYRVQRTAGPAHFLVHGTTIHGAQFQDSARRTIPVTYYHPHGPVGQLFDALRDRFPQKRIGVVGLGTGSLDCYSKPGEDWTFFEIDPVIAKISGQSGYFTYLRYCAVHPRIVFGDARLTLARQPSKQFGLLVIDAFSSDAIPVHLLTRQAFALYRRVLDDDGILFVHISNQHLDLAPVVAQLARDAGLVALLGAHSTNDKESEIDLDYSCDWVALARRPEDLGSLVHDSRWKPLLAKADAQTWTDDYSNVFSVIKW